MGNSGQVRPVNWPPDILYLNSPSYSASLPSSVLSEIRGTQLSLHAPPAKARVLIRRITDIHHPASGQYGLFAARQIESNTHIIDYLGEVHSDERRESDYDLSLLRLPGGINIGIDARTMGNEGRFVNDYRGVRPKPNALFKEGRTFSGELRISIWSASSKIRKGDEILVSYGKSWWRSRTVTTDAQGRRVMETLQA